MARSRAYMVRNVVPIHGVNLLSVGPGECVGNLFLLCAYNLTHISQPWAWWDVSVCMQVMSSNLLMGDLTTPSRQDRTIKMCRKTFKDAPRKQGLTTTPSTPVLLVLWASNCLSRALTIATPSMLM